MKEAGGEGEGARRACAALAWQGVGATSRFRLVSVSFVVNLSMSFIT